MIKPVEPIYTVELFPPISRELLSVLKSLQPDDWGRLTICSPWTVKDVAAHLLGGNLSRLWKRDRASLDSETLFRDYDDLLSLINRENEAWVQAARRISPDILIEFLDITDRRLYEYFKSLAPDELAGITVAWASDSLPPNWFDTAREYTEKWLHQQHIRAAVGQPLLTARTWLFPVIDTFMRGLPHTFRTTKAPLGTSISIQITGEAGGEWSLVKSNLAWELFTGSDPQAINQVQIDQNIAWQLFTKGISRDVAKRQIFIHGNAALGERVLEMVSIMA
jgi:uncharacterized protein (TIGR03083 family)